MAAEKSENEDSEDSDDEENTQTKMDEREDSSIGYQESNSSFSVVDGNAAEGDWELVGEASKKVVTAQPFRDNSEEPFAFRAVAKAQLEEELGDHPGKGVILKRAASLRRQVASFLSAQYSLVSVERRAALDANVRQALPRLFFVDAHWMNRLDNRVAHVCRIHRLSRPAAEEVVVRSWGRPVRDLDDLVTFLSMNGSSQVPLQSSSALSSTMSSSSMLVCTQSPSVTAQGMTDSSDEAKTKSCIPVWVDSDEPATNWGVLAADSLQVRDYLFSLCANTLARTIICSNGREFVPQHEKLQAWGRIPPLQILIQ